MVKLQKHIEDFRDGIFGLRTRRFGTVAEIMIKKIEAFNSSKNLFHDLYDDVNNEEVEVKFSTVMKANDGKITSKNVVEQILNANVEYRAMKSTEISENAFDCNIQQIKRKEFKVLYYGLFFSDKIYIFKIRNDEIETANIRILR